MSGDATPQTNPSPYPQAEPVPGQGIESVEDGEVADPGQAAVIEGAAVRGNRRRGIWAAVAVLCVAGSAGSVLGAHAVARNDAAGDSTGASRRARQRSPRP